MKKQTKPKLHVTVSTVRRLTDQLQLVKGGCGTCVSRDWDGCNNGDGPAR
jgi:hypothetical protein